MNPLLILYCPSCRKPVTVEVPTAMHVDEHGQVYIYCGCARCQTVLKQMLGRHESDPYADAGK
jgi:RNase P subunit RPR2